MWIIIIIFICGLLEFYVINIIYRLVRLKLILSDSVFIFPAYRSIFLILSPTFHLIYCRKLCNYPTLQALRFIQFFPSGQYLIFNLYHNQYSLMSNPFKIRYLIFQSVTCVLLTNLEATVAGWLVLCIFHYTDFLDATEPKRPTSTLLQVRFPRRR